MKHTPGIWQLAEGDGRFIYALYEDGYNRFWCRVDGGKIARATITSEDELVANARLMVSAPDLLDALRDLTNDVCERFDMESSSTNPGIKHCVEQALKAIAKATGEQQ